MKTIYIGIGSNLGDRAENLRVAREHLSDAGIRVTRSSSIYETAPRDLVEQPWFLNQVVEAETELLPLQVLGKLQKIEKSMGPRKAFAKGPRIIDLDILLYGRSTLKMKGLEIPHPRIAERRFVLEPLAELVPDLGLPSSMRSVLKMLDAVMDQEVRRYAAPPDSHSD